MASMAPARRHLRMQGPILETFAKEPSHMSSLSSSNAVKPRRTRRAIFIATMVATALPLGTARATFPGEHGVLVYSASDGIYKTAVVTGSVPVKIASGTFPTLRQPAASPSGKKLAYVRNDDIIIANIDGSSPINLTNGGSVN